MSPMIAGAVSIVDMPGQTVLEVTERAVEKILEIRAQEPDADQFALRVEVTGIRGNEFTYELTFEPLEDAGDEDLVERHGALPVVISRSSAPNLQGATLDLSRDLLEGGLVIDNPNTPSPRITTGEGADLAGPVAEKVAQLLDHQINPAIAMHGGATELVAVEDDTVYLRMQGGCQGCGMAQVTLKQGIEQAIFSAVPEIKRVVDVTDHAAGENPYYAAAK